MTQNQSPQPTVAAERYHLIDALRGLSILLMVGFHLGVNMEIMDMAPAWFRDSALLQNILQPFFGGLFILLAGVSSRFSRSNLRRGAIALACAYAVSAVMIMLSFRDPSVSPVYFGILHFMGVAMLIYGVAKPALDAIPRIVQPFLYGTLFIGTYAYFPIFIAKDTGVFMPLGLYNTWGADYFPLIPWLFLFLFGTWLGALIKERKFPEWFYRFNMPVLPWVGRHTLIIYLAHQPVLYGLLTLINK